MCELLPRESCPACSETSSRTLYESPFDRAPVRDYLLRFYDGRCDPALLSPWQYTLVECATCSLVYQAHVPSPALLKVIYEQWTSSDASREKAAARGLDVRRGYAFQIINVIEYLGRDPADIQVLDYGMGWGTWLRMAAAFGCAVSGAEFAADRIDSGGNQGIEMFDAAELPDGKFHFINAEQVFEHLTEPLETAQRLRRALQPRGILRIGVPNGSDVEARLARGRWDAPKGSPDSLNAVAPLEHLNCFNYRSLVTMAARAGLTEVRIPARQFMSQWQPVRFVASALVHAIRRPRGTMLLFRR